MVIDITLIFSIHKEGGICTANALMQLMECINPDVIFEELSHALYKEAYIEKKLNNLESVAIRNYVANKPVPHIPVDTYERSETYNRDNYYLGKKLTTGAGYESAQLRDLMDQLEERVGQFGFSYLNSNNNDVAIEMLEAVKQKVLKKLNDTELDELHQKYQEIILKREDMMLDNVYRYAKENPFPKGLMFIGSGHRKSMMKKIEERNKTEEVKILWQFYQGEIKV